MMYFRLMQEDRIPYGVLLTQLDQIGGYRAAVTGSLRELDRVIVSTVNPSKLNFYPDVLDRQLFLIKGDVKKVFDLFLREVEYKFCCLLDDETAQHEYYYIPLLDLVPCLSEKSTSNPTGSKVSKVVLEEQLIKGKHIFRVSNTKDTVVVVSLAAAEALLRKKPIGIRLKQVELA